MGTRKVTATGNRCGRAAAGRRYRVGERTVYRWLAEARDEGRREAKPHAGGPRPRVAGTEEVLHELATGPATRDATLAEQAELCEARTDRRLSAATLCRDPVPRLPAAGADAKKPRPAKPAGR